jgi:hypothetical protein
VLPPARPGLCRQTVRGAGFRKWQELGRQVRKGETSIKIMAPHTYKGMDDEGNEETRVYFRAVAVFDRLSRVRSGDVADARVGLRFPAGISLLVCAPGFMREGTGFRLARASRRYPANRRVISRRECRHRVPKLGS